MPASPGASGDSDEVLMERFCQGDAQAFDALFQRYARPVQGYLARLTGSPATAEDLAQLTFLSLVRARGRYQAGARVRPWLYAIATNAARDHARRHRRPEDLTPEGELPLTAVADTPEPRDAGLERAVQRALAQLPEGQRLPILMHRFEGMGFAEIAETLGLTESAVKVRAHRGYARLRELLAPLQQETSR
ncbi:RNA polymerase sigma factor [Corallococcus exiguus]|uniref:RNA polymerase sigma factor n=1 Tax=Corallococcus TaxID=83461 RepID=UPI001470BA87|nr:MULTISPECIES: RNA polymerase sigma factor [Corallococcus]NNB90370.1 RNA polymerase sigma factor [Corallococcus exiguus]NNB95385.1 RNA polymerase sigma factor [Corallococcus exiguus]NNC07051.1 RNA polymerase sigma factor [Corallococcus exiguus]NPC48226.1 RNA polymerase sigma factor [Corallococcus exiguus]